jgi:hypothetical protein
MDKDAPLGRAVHRHRAIAARSILSSFISVHADIVSGNEKTSPSLCTDVIFGKDSRRFGRESGLPASLFRKPVHLKLEIGPDTETSIFGYISAYGTAVPDIVKWSSVMKLTLQPLHSNTLTSGSSSMLGMVRARIIGREQFGQSGDWRCIFPTGRTRVSLIGCNASPTQCFHPH